MLRVAILLVVLTVVTGDGCVRRSFGPDRIVCVCNSEYCDTVNTPILQANQYQTYTSTKDGLRLQFSVYNFSNESSYEDAITFTVDCSEKYQTIFGFGGAMTDAAAINIQTLSNGTQGKLLESYFAADGIGYTYVRIPVAGTDFSTRPYTYDDTPNDDTLSHFSLVEEDGYKIEYLHKIKKIMSDPDSLRIFTASWSAPAWMKTSNNIKWGALKVEYYPLYAEYIKKFFDAYKKNDIEIWGMTPGNEPLNGLFPFFPFNSMFWSPETEANWTVNNLAPTLSKAGYNNVVYMAMDDQRFEMPWFTEGVFKNEEAENLFSGTAVHWYSDGLFSPNRLTETHDKYPDKFILMTEACTGSGIFEEKVILGSWDRGEQYALDIIQNLSHWVTGWVDWNIALNKKGEPNWAKNFVDSPIITIPEKDEFYKQPMFYALAHFSRFVPRDSYRIQMNSGNVEDIKSIAFFTPKNEIVVVMVNKSNRPYNTTIQDKNESNNIINVHLPANSFTTVLYMASQQC